MTLWPQSEDRTGRPNQPDQPDQPDRSGIGSLHGWYDACWVLLGLSPSAIAALGHHGPSARMSLALLTALGLGYGFVRLRPGNRVLPSRALVLGVVPVLGMMAMLPGGGAALLIVSLPLFWIHTGGRRQAIALSGAATLTTALGSIAAQGRTWISGPAMRPPHWSVSPRACWPVCG